MTKRFLGVTTVLVMTGCGAGTKGSDPAKYSPEFAVPAAIRIPVQRFQYSNGLTLLVNEDHSSPLVAVSMLYRVGSAREERGQYGLAHFVEHLLYDETMPKGALELALWMESERIYRARRRRCLAGRSHQTNRSTTFWSGSSRSKCQPPKTSCEWQRRISIRTRSTSSSSATRRYSHLRLRARALAPSKWSPTDAGRSTSTT